MKRFLIISLFLFAIGLMVWFGLGPRPRHHTFKSGKRGVALTVSIPYFTADHDLVIVWHDYIAENWRIQATCPGGEVYHGEEPKDCGGANIRFMQVTTLTFRDLKWYSRRDVLLHFVPLNEKADPDELIWYIKQGNVVPIPVRWRP